MRGDNMKKSIRSALLGVAAIAMLPCVAAAQALKPAAVTPELIEAAKNEGQVVFYASEELEVVSQIAKSFEALYPGIKVQI